MTDADKTAGERQDSGLPLIERRRRFVVCMDATPECRKALRFATARAAHVKGGSLVIFHVIPPAEFQHWMAVEDRMREEAFEEAEHVMQDIADQLYRYAGIRPEIVIRQGQPRDELQAYLEETSDIFALFLGASAEEEPGPLVSYFCGPMAGRLNCPVVIVPGRLTDEQIDAMA